MGGMTNKILQLQRDVEDILPLERVKLMSRDANKWTAGRRRNLVESREETRLRLKNAREMEGIHPDNIPGRGEIKRIT